MKYDLVLLDADGTLFDFDAAEEAAFKATSSSFYPSQAPDSLARLFVLYKDINRAIWAELERGEIEKDELKVERFRRLFSRAREALTDPSISEALDPEAFARDYLSTLATQDQLLPGSESFVRALASMGARIAVASNGVGSVQRGRFALSPLGSSVGELLISEELGAEKPAVAFFEAAFEKLGRPLERKEGVLMVGDSWSADVMGALGFGLDAVWLNLKGATAPFSHERITVASSYEAVLQALV